MEVRFLIYEEVLVVGRVFYTPTEEEADNSGRMANHTLFRKPELQLLRVCQQIHDEAEPIYLKNNLFVLPSSWYQCLPFDSQLEASRINRYLFSAAGLKYIRNLSIAVDQGVVSALWDVGNYSFAFWTRAR